MGRCPAGHPISGPASELRRNTRASGKTAGGNQAQAAAPAGAAHQPPALAEQLSADAGEDAQRMNNELWKWRRVESGESKNRLPPLPTTPWKSRRRREIPTFPQLRRRTPGWGKRKQELETVGPWETGNPKAGFPLSHRPDSLRQQGRNHLQNKKPGPSPTAQNGDTSIEVTPGTFLTRLDTAESSAVVPR